MAAKHFHLGFMLRAASSFCCWKLESELAGGLCGLVELSGFPHEVSQKFWKDLF